MVFTSTPFRQGSPHPCLKGSGVHKAVGSGCWKEYPVLHLFLLLGCSVVYVTIWTGYLQEMNLELVHAKDTRLTNETASWNRVKCIAAVYSVETTLLVVYTQGLDTRPMFHQSPDAVKTVKFCQVGNHMLPIAWSRLNIHACLMPSEPPSGTPVTLVTVEQMQLPSEAYVVLPLRATEKHRVCATTQISLRQST